VAFDILFIVQFDPIERFTLISSVLSPLLPATGNIPSEFRGIFMTWQQFKQAWLIKFWSPVPAVIAAGILSTYYFGITGTFWAVTGEFTRWGGQLLQLVGVHSEEWG
jgi:hypothetical protein